MMNNPRKSAEPKNLRGEAGSPKAKRKSPGRKRIRRTFDETRIAHYLKHEAPLEYKLIIEANGASSAPPADLIEAVGYASDNPLFRKPKFRRCLIKYRKYGLYAGRPVKTNANIELYYIKIRRKMADGLGIPNAFLAVLDSFTVL